jgi:hypothetical protein
MATVSSGVYPVYKNQFEINTKGRSGEGTGTFVTIADMESFSVSFDDNVEEWTPMTTEGWVRRLKTGKGVTISLTGKRNIGDPGNDYIASLAWKTGQDCNSELKWNFPNGDSVLIPCVINVTSAGGDSTGVEPLECECMSDGQPAFTEANA